MRITQNWLDSALINDSIVPRRRKAKCADGFEVSIQASAYHYCDPRDNSGPYWEVELGFPTATPSDAIMQYAERAETPTDTVYGFVPIELVDALIAEHGGLVELEEGK